MTIAQDTSRVWVTIEDPSIIKANPASRFDELTNRYSILSMHQAFPNSHTPSLLKVYELSCICDNRELAAALGTTYGVKGPEPIFDPVYLFTPNDYSIAFEEDYALDLINAQGAWNYTTGDTSVILGITDQSYDMTHEELQGKVVAGGTPGATAAYHGTAVAVTAAGNTNNGLGKSAIGYDCRLVLFTAQYNDLLVSRDSGAVVVNASWEDGSCAPNPYCQQIIDELYYDGVVVVAAAGNGAVTCGDSYGVAYPAGYKHVISVTSVGPNDNHERYPGDPTSAHQHNPLVDLSAPGYDVALTVGAGWYLTGNGTSFAAPYVTGTVGLMLSINPCLTVDQVEDILKETAVNIDSLNPAYAGLIGSGRLNAEAAVAMAFNYPGTIGTPCHLQLTAGLNESQSGPELGIYPNPSNGTAQLRYPFETGQSVVLIDALGRTERVISISESTGTISLETLPAGMYIVLIRSGARNLQQQRLLVL